MTGHNKNCAQACYKQFLVENQDELLRNIEESIKSVNEKISRQENLAWTDYERLNEEMPSDDENEETTTSRMDRLSKITRKLEKATAQLLKKREDLLKTRQMLCQALNLKFSPKNLRNL